MGREVLRKAQAHEKGEPDNEKVDHRNNVIYNWGFNSAYGGEAGNEGGDMLPAAAAENSLELPRSNPSILRKVSGLSDKLKSESCGKSNDNGRLSRHDGAFHFICI